MVKWWNIEVDIYFSQNGKMVKQLYSPLSDLSFARPSDDEYQAWLFIASSDASAISSSVVSGRCRVDCLIVPLSSPMPLYAVSPPWFWSIHFLFTFLPQLPIPGGVVPFCNLLIFAIFLRSYTGDILYYLCATVTYRNFTGSVWFPVWPLCKGIILYPCIICTRSTQQIGSKTWMCYQIYNF